MTIAELIASPSLHRNMSSTVVSGYEALMRENTFDRYYVEYGGFLSNHLSHGLIALHRLGATDSYVTQFSNWYTGMEICHYINI